MTKPFLYSVLRYRPSYLLEEQINVGLLFVFPDDGEVIFQFPTKLARITQFYSAADLPILRKYLYAFKTKAKKAEAESTTFDDFIPKDASSLYLTKPKNGTYIIKEEILSYYKGLYFKSYYENEFNRKDDAYLKRTFETKLKAFAPTKQQFFKRNITVKNTIASTRFDYAWQNGKTNLIKTIGLDLATTTNIQKKAFRWYGELTELKDNLQEANIDILVSRPSSKDLYKAYDKALLILDNIKTTHQIREEAQLQNYLNHAIETVRELPDLDFVEVN
jgi:hypothetical protein